MNPADGDFDPTKFGFPPPLTKVQGNNRRKADHALQREHPDKYVGYIDTWNGDEPARNLVIVAENMEEYYRLKATLRSEIRDQVHLDHVRDPNGPIFCPYFRMEDEDAPYIVRGDS